MPRKQSEESRVMRESELVLVTGASGFIGPKLVDALLRLGFLRLRCLVRPWSNLAELERVSRAAPPQARIELMRGNLLSREDCARATKNAARVYHLAAGRGQKMVPEAFMNSVVTTRNLLDACRENPALRRFVSISSFAVYTNRQKRQPRLLDEACPVEQTPALRGDAYCFAKVKQDEIVDSYCRASAIPYVIVRPGYVYGPGNEGLPGRVGTSTFGLFLHLGGSNPMPLTFVDNCADAIALAGVAEGIDGEVFNVVDRAVSTTLRQPDSAFTVATPCWRRA